MTISDVAIKRPVFTAMVSLGIGVLGFIALGRLGVNLFPDIQFPVVTVTTVYPGASPAEIETQVTEKIEDALISLPGIDRLESHSLDSVSQVIIVFDLNVDIIEAATQVRERVAQIRADLPRQAEDPAVARLDVGAAPIMLYTLRGPGDVQELRDYAQDDLRPLLEQVEGVATINVRGGHERQINVLLDLDALVALGMTPLDVVERIGFENISVPAGGFDEGDRRVAVRTLGELTSVDELRRLPMGTGPGGSIVRLGDIAAVEDGFADTTEIVRANGAPAIVFEVLKASGANTVEVAQAVAARLEEIEMPPGVEAGIILDQAEFILENVHEVQVALWFGGAMAILVILVFLLDWRSTFISGLALPTSVLGAFFLMWLLGFTLNMMTLLGLSLAIGLLIDDSIVVRENIMKYLEKGYEPLEAAQKGTQEITLAVLATTATLCAVFVPVAFTEGMVGQFFREFGLTIAGATLVSTWVALTLDPMLSARLAVRMKPGEEQSDGPFGFIVRPMRSFYETLDSLYGALLSWILAKRWRMGVTLGVTFAIFVSSFGLLGLMGNEFTSPEDRGMFNVDIELPAGTRIEESARLSLAAEQELVADPNFITVYAHAGSGGRPNMVTWRIVALRKNERELTQPQLQEMTREIIMRNIPDAEVSITDPAIVDGARDYPIQIDVIGDDLDAISATGDRFAEIFRSIPGTRDVDVQFSPGSPELAIHIDRDRASQLGLPLAAIARTVRTSIEGDVAGLYRDGDDEIDIRVRLREEDRAHAGLVGGLRMRTPGGFVPLSDLATVERAEGPSEIRRVARRRVVTVTCSTSGRPMGDVMTEFLAVANAEQLPPGVEFNIEGQAKMMMESNANMGIALWLGIIFIYLVLASQFESLLHPVTIMMALPLAIVGAIVALFLQGSSMSMGASIGMILLMGLVTKNGILLVDHAQERRREGWTAFRAILDAGPSRLRPILMTSAAMVLGMLPTALNNGPGSEFRGPMAMGVIGGVISSTFLTLLVVPVFYLLVEWVQRTLKIIWVQWIKGEAMEIEADTASVAHSSSLDEEALPADAEE